MPSSFPLLIRKGTENHHMLKVKHLVALERETRTGQKVREGTLTSWERVGVFFGANGAVIFEELEPGDQERTIQQGELFVKGRFQVVRRETYARKAEAAWKAFEAR